MVIIISHILDKIENELSMIPVYVIAIIIIMGPSYIVISDSNTSSNAFFITLATILPLSIVISFIGYGCHRGQKYLNDKFLQGNEYIQGNCDREYSAILIGNNVSWTKKLHVNMSICGLKYLEKTFENSNKDYKIFQKINKSIFNTIVSDIKCQELYLLGHGSKGTFTVSTNKAQNDWEINYLEYKNEPKKRIIAQLHCAGIHHERNNKSLVHLLADEKDNSYVANGYIIFISVWLYCVKMLKKSK